MKYILIVEDDHTLREGLVLALQNNDISVCSAADLASARRILRERTFDLLLLDCNLPDGSGIELCREMTAVQDPFPNLLQYLYATVFCGYQRKRVFSLG